MMGGIALADQDAGKVGLSCSGSPSSFRSTRRCEVQNPWSLRTSQSTVHCGREVGFKLGERKVGLGADGRIGIAVAWPGQDVELVLKRQVGICRAIELISPPKAVTDGRASAQVPTRPGIYVLWWVPGND